MNQYILLVYFFMHMWFSLVILAAWFGSRYWWLKQLDGFGPHSEPIILYSIYDALRFGCDHVVFVIRKEIEDDFKLLIGNVVEKYVRVSYVFQTKELFVPNELAHLISYREKPWGTAHATLAVKDVVNQPFAIINADDYYGRDAFQNIASFLSHIQPDQLCMVWYILENTLSPYWSINRWVCKVNEWHLTEVVEHLKIKSDDLWVLYDEIWNKIDNKSIVSMNFWWFHHSIFPYFYKEFTNFLQDSNGQGEFFIPIVVDKCIHEEGMDCFVMMSHDQRCGVSYQEDKPFVQETIASLHRQWIYPDQLFA